MKPKFTEEQLDYLKKCADQAYSNRWNLGEDYFIALDEFLSYFRWSLKKEEEFEDLMRKASRDENSSYEYNYEKYNPF